MQEPIYWRYLHQRDRDALVAKAIGTEIYYATHYSETVNPDGSRVTSSIGEPRSLKECIEWCKQLELRGDHSYQPVAWSYEQYTTDLDSTWEVIQHMKNAGFSVSIWSTKEGKWCVEFDNFTSDGFDNYKYGLHESEDFGDAVCVAVLRAKGIEVEA